MTAPLADPLSLPSDAPGSSALSHYCPHSQVPLSVPSMYNMTRKLMKDEEEVNGGFQSPSYPQISRGSEVASFRST